MPQFAYKARDLMSNQVSGVMVAEDEKALALALKKGNIYLTHASPVKERKKRIPKVRRRELIEFTVHMATVLSAGIPILEGLEDFEKQVHHSGFRRVLKGVREELGRGATLHSALANYPTIFSETYTNMIKAGEASGELDLILKDLVAFLEWQEELSSNIKKASVYPIMILIAVGLLMTTVFAFAFPKIIRIIVEMKVELPLITKVMIGLSTFFANYWHLVFIGIILAIFSIKMLGKTSRGKMLLDKVKLRLPIIGPLIRKIALSKFAHHLGLLYKAGIDIITSLKLVEGIVGNLVIARDIARARERITAGETLFESLQKSKEFSPLVLRMIRVGEVSGEIDVALSKVSQYYDREVPDTVKKIFSIMEPAIIVFLAATVLMVALSMYLPLYSALGRLGK